MSSVATAAARRVNLCLMGPPGSGKGSYGKFISKTLGVPLITVSDILREDDNHSHRMQTGTLIDDKTVNDTVSNYLQQKHRETGYILDGYPRTHAQLDLMRQTWPSPIQPEAAVSLEVPMQVCKEKMLGRRYCKKCNKSFNTSHVRHGEFDLPAQLPSHPECHDKENGSIFCQDHWISRPDDVEDIVQQRLDTHETHIRPILEQFGLQQRLLLFVPNRGYEDLPRLELAIQNWLQEWKNESSKH